MAGSAPILTILPHASALTEDQGIEQFGSRRRAIERDDEGAPAPSCHLQGLTATNDDARGAWRPAKPPSPEVRQWIDVDHPSRLDLVERNPDDRPGESATQKHPVPVDGQRPVRAGVAEHEQERRSLALDGVTW